MDGTQVWGTWNGITPRDGEQIRRVGAILRFLGGRGYLQSQGWVPHSPTTAPASLFASMWPMAGTKSASSPGSAAWTVVNRDGQNPHAGPAINVTSSAPSWHYYDLWHGEKIDAPPTAGGQLELELEAAGYGAVLATPNTTDSDPELAAFLAKMKAMTVRLPPSLPPSPSLLLLNKAVLLGLWLYCDVTVCCGCVL